MGARGGTWEPQWPDKTFRSVTRVASVGFERHSNVAESEFLEEYSGNTKK